MSFLAEMRRIAEQARKVQQDPFFLKLSTIKGRVGTDGVERINSHDLFDALELPANKRRGGDGRRVAAIMRSLGWHSIRRRSISRTGQLEGKIRGWARLKQQPPAGGAPAQTLQP